MSGLNDIVNIDISLSGSAPQEANFGTPLICAYHTHYTDRVRSYSSLSAMVADDFDTDEAAYKAAQDIFSQNPAPPEIKIGRRALAFTQVIDLTPGSPSTGEVYSVTIDGITCAYVAQSGDVLSNVCTNLAAAINYRGYGSSLPTGASTTFTGNDSTAIIATGGVELELPRRPSRGHRSTAQSAACP